MLPPHHCAACPLPKERLVCDCLSLSVAKQVIQVGSFQHLQRQHPTKTVTVCSGQPTLGLSGKFLSTITYRNDSSLLGMKQNCWVTAERAQCLDTESV